MTDITKKQLESKPLEQWSQEERQAAQQMSHTLTADYLTVRKLAQRGTKAQSYQDILEMLLSQSISSPGIYLINSTGEACALATEDGGVDRALLEEALDEHTNREVPA